MTQPARTVTEPSAREKIHAAIDAHLDFHELQRTEGRMWVEIPLAGGKPVRCEIDTYDRRQDLAPRGRRPKRLTQRPG